MGMITVVLPCLDESEALPWVLNRMPTGYHPIVVDIGEFEKLEGCVTCLSVRLRGV